MTLSLTGAVDQEVASRTDRRTFPPPGELIELGSHSLHLNCTGHGNPAVILEAGNLGMSADWIKIQQRVAETTRVCSYDRAGPAGATPDLAPVTPTGYPPNCTRC